MQEPIGWSGKSCKLTNVHVVQRRAFFIVWGPKKYGPLTPLTNSKFEFVSAKTASCRSNSDSLANFAMPTVFYFFACTPEATCEILHIQRVNGNVTLDWSSRAAYHILAEDVYTALYMNATGRSRASNHKLAEGIWTASYVKLNLAVWQPSLAQQGRSFSNFSLSMTTLLAWIPEHSPPESTANDMFVSNSTAKRSFSRPLYKSTSCIMHRPNVCDRSQCMWTSICPYKTDRSQFKSVFACRLHHWDKAKKAC